MPIEMEIDNLSTTKVNREKKYTFTTEAIYTVYAESEADAISQIEAGHDFEKDNELLGKLMDYDTLRIIKSWETPFSEKVFLRARQAIETVKNWFAPRPGYIPKLK